MNQYSNRPARSSSRGRLAVVAVLILILSLLMSSTSATPVAAYAQEVTAAQVLAPEVDVYPATLVHTIDTYLFSPPSPDPTGITYISTSNRLLISDAEVEEMVDTLYDGVNLWETSLSGTVVRTSSTVVFPNYMFFEPEGVSYNPNNGHLFFADDDQKVVFEVAAGADGSHGTLDDVVTSFDTAAFGSEKPLGVAYSAQLNTLFIADYTDAAVYKVTPGANGVFDGVAPEGDDQVTSFSTASFGVFALEGIAFNPANGLLYLCGQSPNNMVAVVTTDGTLLWMIDISAANPYNPSDMAIAPSSLNPAVTHIYISDRGDVLAKKVGCMFTDPQRIRRTDPGRPEICNVFTFHKLYASDEKIQEIDRDCRGAAIGCTDCKRRLYEELEQALREVHERQDFYRAHPEDVRAVIEDGTARAIAIARDTMKEVREAVRI